MESPRLKIYKKRMVWLNVIMNCGERIEEKREMEAENMVLCGASSYEQKYYFNEKFKALPEHIKKELQIMCVLFTEDVGGILTLEYEPDGTLEFKVQSEEQDYLFDEIGSGLKIRQYQREKKELLESLELYYRVVFLGDTMEELYENKKEQDE